MLMPDIHMATWSFHGSVLVFWERDFHFRERGCYWNVGGLIRILDRKASCLLLLVESHKNTLGCFFSSRRHRTFGRSNLRPTLETLSRPKEEERRQHHQNPKPSTAKEAELEESGWILNQHKSLYTVQHFNYNPHIELSFYNDTNNFPLCFLKKLNPNPLQSAPLLVVARSNVKPSQWRLKKPRYFWSKTQHSPPVMSSNWQSLLCSCQK